MRKLIYFFAFFIILTKENIAQPVFDWSFFAEGTATSMIEKTVMDANDDILGLGVFYGGDMIVDGTTYPQDLNITNHFVIKVSSAGSVVWLRPGFHNSHSVQTDGTDVFVSAQDTIYKLDGSNGSVIWKSPVSVAAGTIYPTIPLAVMTDGNPVFALQYEGEDLTMVGDTTDDPFYSAFLVLGKMQSSNGQVIWKNQIEYPSMIALVSHCDLKTDSQDNIYMLTDLDSMGTMNLGNGVQAMFDPSTQSRGDFIAQFNSSGVAQWSRSIAGPDSVQVFTHSFALSPDETSIYLSGFFTHSYYPAPSVGFEVAGMNIVQLCSYGSGLRNFYVTISTNNTAIADLSLDNCYSNKGSYSYENNTGDYYLIGDFMDSLFAGNDTLLNPGTEFISYLAKFDSLNNFLYSYEMPNGLLSAINSDLEFFPGGPLLIAGTAYDSTRSSHRTFFIGKTISPLGTEELTNDEYLIRAYPNPVDGILTVETGNEFVGGNLKVLDITGRTIKSEMISGEKTLVGTTDLQQGIYIISVYNSAVSRNIKVVVKK